MTDRDLIIRQIAVLDPVDHYVEDQWKIVERLLADGVHTEVLTKELRKLLFIGEKVIKILKLESQAGAHKHEKAVLYTDENGDRWEISPIIARMRAVFRYVNTATTLLERMGEA
jgi:hypothetical protein